MLWIVAGPPRDGFVVFWTRHHSAGCGGFWGVFGGVFGMVLVSGLWCCGLDSCV